MNTKQSLVAAAWVLGSTLLVDGSQIAKAQQGTRSPADEYYAPQRTSAKPAPGLLPSALRSPSDSSDEPVARPIPVARDAGSKFSGNGPKPMVRPSNRSVQATMYQQPSAPVQPANQSNGAPSPVQQQLEELYRRDGRQMPPMTLQQAPNTQPITGQNQNGQNQIQRPQPGAVSPAGQHAAPPVAAGAIPPKQASRVGFFSKLNPFKSRPTPTPAPLPQQPAHPIQNQNGVAGRSPNGQPFVQPKTMTAPGQFNPAPKQFNNANAARLQTAPVNQVPIAPAPPAQFEPKIQAAATAADFGSELSKVLPPVPGDPDYIAPKGDAAEGATKPIATVDAAIENAFSDMPEEAADGSATAAKIQPDALPETKPEPNPFSGLSLDDESTEIATPQAAKPSPKLAAEVKDEADALSLDDDKETKSKIDLDSIPLPAEAEDMVVAEEKAEKSVDEPKTQVTADEIDAKVKLIKERGELRGLKGFCAVALRDSRDLKNALPEHTATYKGRTYYFSSDDAKVAFEKHPEQYAPVSGGNDVVLLKEKVTKEGSLDHAVWFKDRLYLFTSQKTLEQFVTTPSGFVISE